MNSDERMPRWGQKAQSLVACLGLTALLIGFVPNAAAAAADDPPCDFTTSQPAGSVAALQGTSHLWVQDASGDLHWAGDTRALADKAVRWDSRCTGDLGFFQQIKKSDPWLSAGLVKVGDPIYLAKWESSDATPTLLHIASIRDVELFGIGSDNYSRFVLDRGVWEQRYGFNTDSLAKGTLAPAVASAAGPINAAPAAPSAPISAAPAAAAAPSAATSLPGVPGCSPMDEGAYLTGVVDKLSPLRASLSRTNALFDSPQPTSSVWRSRVRTEMQVWKAAYPAFSTLCPPTKYQEFHSKNLSALELMGGAADDILASFDLIERALSGGSSSLITQATSRLDQAVAKMTAANRLLAEANQLLQQIR